MAAAATKAARMPALVIIVFIVLNCWFIYFSFVPYRHPLAQRLHGLLGNITSSGSRSHLSPALDCITTEPSLAAGSSTGSNRYSTDSSVSLEESTSGSNSRHNSAAQSNSSGFCDVTKGRWLPDSRPPLYTNDTCKLMYPNQNCMRNGRPDLGYLNWRWWPDDCELPYFDPPLFLHIMRGKKMAFIGDSLARNHMQSLLCALAQVEAPVQVSSWERANNEIWWSFPSYNFTLAAMWSAFLVKAVVNGVEWEGFPGSKDTYNLHLDVPDRIWLSKLDTLDMIVINSGNWYHKAAVYYHNNTLLGTTPYSGLNLTKLEIQDAYRIMYENMLRYLVEKYKGVVLVKTITLSHFENGSWDNGGYCNRTSPSIDPDIEMPQWGIEMRRSQLEEFEKATKDLSPDNASRFRILDVTGSAHMRPDGHPDIYVDHKPGEAIRRDCLHWCMPGPIDMWNQLILHTLKTKPPFRQIK